MTKQTIVSIPLEQGGVFRLIHANYKDAFMRLNPFRTGQGLSTAWQLLKSGPISFNPFGAGQGLSTSCSTTKCSNGYVSIPLEQGGVFRQQGWFGALLDKA